MNWMEATQVGTIILLCTNDWVNDICVPDMCMQLYKASPYPAYLMGLLKKSQKHSGNCSPKNGISEWVWRTNLSKTWQQWTEQSRQTKQQKAVNSCSLFSGYSTRLQQRRHSNALSCYQRILKKMSVGSDLKNTACITKPMFFVMK